VRAVIALGGNALLERTDPPDAEIQQRHVRVAAQAIAPFAADSEILICHGNGPQIGVLAAESSADVTLANPFPLDALGAQTQGMIGYWLAQELANSGVSRPIAVVVTQTVVDAADPAFSAPTKFIGRPYTETQARMVAAQHGWSVAADGDAWRRVVPSPEPREIVELAVIQHLLRMGALVICGGGGGAPVVRNGRGLRGVDAVVDKDLFAALVASECRADRLVILTDVPAVERDFGTPRAAPLGRVDVSELETMHAPAGSMGPKVAAAIRFVSGTGAQATIGALAQAAEVLAGHTGTVVTATSSDRPERRVG
jgi:carbamate kinase